MSAAVSESSSSESWGARLRRLAATYGPLAIGVHLSVEAVVLGGFYWSLGNGLDVDVLAAEVEAATGFKVPLSPTASRALAAYVLTTTLTGFPRTILTVVATPWLAKRIGWKGFPPRGKKKTTTTTTPK